MPDSSPKESFKIENLLTIAGYLLVVVIIYFLGKAIKLDLGFSAIEVDSYSFFYFSIIGVYYTSKAIYVDLNSVKSEEDKLKNFSFVIITFVFISTSVVCAYNIIMKSFYLPNVVILLLGLLPFAKLYNFERNNFGSDRRIHFANYIFFPAILTCILPFFVGYTLEYSIYDTNKWIGCLYMLIVSSIILLYHGLHCYFYEKNYWIHMMFSIILVFSLFIISYISYSYQSRTTYLEFSQYIIVVAIMALLMGIPESWYFLKDSSYIEHSNHNYRILYDKYSKAINTATLMIPLLMILGFLHPIVNDNYLFVIVFSFFLLFIWLIKGMESSKILGNLIKVESTMFWKLIRLLLGYSLPILVFFAISKTMCIINLSFIDSIDVDAILRNSVLFSFGMASLFSLFGLTFNNNDEIHKTLIFGSVLILFGVSIFEGFFNINNQTFVHKLTFVKLAYLTIFLITFCISVYSNMSLELFKFDKQEDSSKGESSKSETLKVNTTILKLISFSKLDRNKFICAIVKSGRPIPSFLAMLLSFLFFYILGNYSIFRSLVHSAPMFIVTSLGFMYNDMFDYKKDNHRYNDKPLKNGSTDGFHILIAFLIYLFLLILLLNILSGYLEFLCIFSVFIGVYFYSPFSHRLPVFKGLYTSFLTISPIAYPAILTGKTISFTLLGAIILFITGREIILDVFDFEYDSRFGLKTLPHYLGFENSKIVSYILMILAIYLFFLSSVEGVYSLILAIILVIMLFLTLGSSRSNNELRFTVYTRVIMFIGIILIYL